MEQQNSEQIEFCRKFGLKDEERELVKVRAEKKCRAVIEYLGLAPTDDDLATGTVFKIQIQGCTFKSAFISTKKGGLIGAIIISTRDGGDHTPSELRDWVCREVYNHHKTAEDIAQLEDYKRMREAYLVKRAEWEKRNQELRRAEYEELAAQVRRTALPNALVDELVTLASRKRINRGKTTPAVDRHLRLRFSFLRHS
jgi:hypothetical protein